MTNGAAREPRAGRGAAWRWGLALAVVLAALVATRFSRLGADPPYWFHECVTDEGWWADSARGKVLFNDYFADDFGTAYLVTPLYTWILQSVYSVLGVGNVPTRALAAVSSVLVVSIVCAILWGIVGVRGAVVGGAMLAASPFFWAHGRVGLIEPTQAVFTAGSFGLWLLARRRGWAAFGSGLLMAGAIAVKPNALVLGLFPLGAAALATCIADARGGAGAPSPASPRRAGVLPLLLLGAGIVVGLGIVFVVHAIPEWDRFRAMLISESEIDEPPPWTDYLKLPGVMTISDYVATWPVLWRVARWSPAIVLGGWLFGLGLVLDVLLRRENLLKRYSTVEITAAVWTVATWLTLFASTLDRRFVLWMPGVAILASLYVSRRLGWLPGREVPQGESRRPGRFSSFVIWAVALVPAMIVVKPWAILWVMRLSRHFRDNEISLEAAGTLFMAAWFFVVLGASLLRQTGVALSRLALGRAGLTLVAAFFVYECFSVGQFLATSESTFLDRQAELRAVIRPGETVLGHMSATLLQGLRVRTVRRSAAVDRTPPPNPDVWERLRPRYLLEMRRSNFHAAGSLYEDLIRSKGYRSVRRFEAGPLRNGVRRYEFDLMELPDDGPAGEARTPAAGRNRGPNQK